VLSALACHGLGDVETATGQLQQVLADDPNHLSAADMLAWFRQWKKATPKQIAEQISL
jgi:hypothetical protein